jgi:hypothetical protein
MEKGYTSIRKAAWPGPQHEDLGQEAANPMAAGFILGECGAQAHLCADLMHLHVHTPLVNTHTEPLTIAHIA